MGIDRVHNFRARYAALEQFLRIQVDGHQAVRSAVRGGELGSFNVGQASAEKIGAEVLHLLDGERLAAEANLQYGHVCRAIRKYKGRLGARRHAANRNLRLRGNLGHGVGEVGTRLKKDLDNGLTVVALSLHVLNIVDGCGEGAFEATGKAVFDIERRKSRVIGDHGNYGNIDIREDVDGSLYDGYAGQDENEQRKHHKSVGAVECKSYYPHKLVQLGFSGSGQIWFACRGSGSKMIGRYRILTGYSGGRRLGPSLIIS